MTVGPRPHRQTFVSTFGFFFCLGTAVQVVAALVHAGHDSLLQRAGYVLLGSVSAGLAVALYEWHWRRRQAGR